MPSYIRARSEFAVNSYSAADQTAPSVSTFADGGFVVTWVTTDSTQDGNRSAIKAQLFDLAGSKVGTEFLVNSAANGQQSGPSVAAFDNGNFLVTWMTNISDNGTDGIKAQLYNRLGAPIGAEFQVNASAGSLFEANVTSLADGRFIISWDDWTSASVKAQIFDAAGSRVGGILTVASTSAQGFGDIIGLANGGFVATWRVNGTSWDVKAQVFSASGTRVGGEFLVNTTIAGSQNAPAATALADGGFVITWSESNPEFQSGNTRIKAQVFAASGAKVGGELLVSTSTAYSMGGQVVTALPDGGFIVAWYNTNLIPGGGSDSDLKAQRFTAAGVKVDGEFQINTLATGSQWLPDLDTLADGRVIAVWASGSGDISGQSVRAQILGTEVAAPLPNTAPVIISNGGGASVALTMDEGLTAVTNVVASDDGEPLNLRYSITGGADAALFTINALTGALAFRQAPDHEAPRDQGADSVYNVVVTVSDGQLSDTQSLAIEVRHVNHVLIVSDGGYDYASVSADENQTVVTTVSALDDDGLALTYTITGGEDAAFFTIDAQTGELRFTAAPDYEHPANMYGDNVYLVQVTASDGTVSDTQDLAVYVNDVEEPNGFAIVSNGGGDDGQIGVPENSVAVTVVATQGAAGPVTYEIVGGFDSDRFTIDASTGELSFIGAPDFEETAQAGPSSHYYYYGGYQVVVRAGDGTSYDEQELKVVVEDVDEAPLFYSYWGDAHVALTMGENTLATFAVSAKDPDQNSWVTYGLEGPDADLFTVDPYEGGLSLRQALDFEAPADADGDNVYEVTVVAYSGAFSATQAFSITIADDYEPVTITSDGGGTAASLSVPENDAAVTVVHASGDGFITYQIVGGTDASYFKIDPYTGAVEFVVAPDYEGTRRAAGGRPHSGEPPSRFTEPGLHGNTYDLLVRASNGSSFDDQRLTINVTNVDEAPVILSYSGQASVALTLFENATSIGSLIAADPDGTPVTFAIAGGADAALFAVDPASGALRFKQGPDFEVPADAGGDNVYQVSVVASSGTLSAAQSFSITIRDVNENVTITSNGGGDAAAVAVAENLTAVTTVAASGPGAVTFSIVGGADAADFTIDASTGALAFAQAPNFEGTADTDHDNVYEVIVRASNGSTSDDQLLSVNLANVDETPDFFDHVEGVIELSTIENRSYVGDLLAFDVDGGPAITYSIAGGADGALFAIDPVTGSLSLLNASGPDFEAPADSDGDNVYEVEVTATAGAWSRTRAFAVTVDDQNEAIVITSNGGGTSVSISMDEGGNYVTTIVGHDPDGTAPAYSIIGGPDAARFTIDSATGVLSFVDRPDFEAPADSGGANFYTVQVGASDGQSLAWQTVQIRVGNVNEPLAITSSGGGSSASVAVSENGRSVAVVAAADPDGASPTSSIAGGADASRFTIDAQTGALQFVSAPDREAPADANADNVYDVVVRASDGTFFDDQALSVTVGNVDEGVDLVSYGGQATIFLTLGENGVSVGQVAGRDQDGDPVTYAIAGGADAGRFRVDAATGALSFISSPDFEAPADANGDNVYKVEVAAIAGAFSAVQTFALTVANVNEGLSITSNGGGSSALVWVGENSRAVTSVAAIDADGTAATYSIVGGADASRFTIDPQTGALQFVAAPDFELPADADGDNVYSVVVQAGDGQFTDSQALSVSVANLRDGNNVAGTTGGDAISGTNSNPALRTSNSEDTVFGRDGNDTISGLGGDDYLYGDAGNDNLAGGAGADRLTGGAGKDEFIYNLASESTAVSRDVITDFSHAQNDRINLSAIDANTNLVNNQAFTFIGSAAFSHVAGQLRFEQVGGNTFVSGDVNGDGVADFQIELTGSITPVASDFAL